MNRNVLIDFNNVIHRVWAAFVLNSEITLTNDCGYPTGLTYGFFSALSDWISDIKRPTRIIAFLDGVPKRRFEIDPDYKNVEKERPWFQEISIKLSDGYEPKNQIDLIIHLMGKFGISHYHHKECEADDLIASFVRQNPDDLNIILSTDKDFFQLLDNEKVIIYRVGVKGDRFFDREKAISHMEHLYKVPVKPEQIKMFKALTGDPSDNIKGVPRLRKKVAASVCDFSSVDEIIASGMHSFSKKEKSSLISLKEMVERNLELVQFSTDINLNSYYFHSDPDFKTGSKILNDDLSINNVSYLSFDLTGKEKARLGNPEIPDWLADL